MTGVQTCALPICGFTRGHGRKVLSSLSGDFDGEEEEKEEEERRSEHLPAYGGQTLGELRPGL